ncbi:MAG: hypothetical protein C4520_02400 [Candidatus Abyssobacteria bacterium SURF_5]|uniref:Polysaccharide chain length determinant N-terminal domain-containing protein n=1 Tax=Abyssobacteria bacterium (strain SURF_5) TaxID=2093360 RepID=A0A3A4NYA5_ABYX5|nr:MAG: hypothetical protein C4520_02400 [Candidatus Abyssubacteria bacterium SURF_5]
MTKSDYSAVEKESLHFGYMPIKEKEPQLFDYLSIIYRRRGMIYVVTISCIIATAVLSYTLPKTYQATISAFFTSQNTSVDLTAGSNGNLPPLPTGQESVQKGILGILKSGTVAEIVERKVGKRSLRHIKWNTDFDINSENLIEIDVRDRDPEVAALIANVFVEAANEFYSGIATNPFGGMRDYLEHDIEEYTIKLRDAEDGLQQFHSKNNIASLQEELTILINQKAGIEATINDTLVLIQQNDKERESLEVQMEQEGLLVLNSDILSYDSFLQTQKEDLARLEGEIASEKYRLKPDHPRMISLEERRVSIEQAISSRINQIMNSTIKPADMHYETLRKNLTANLIQATTLAAKRDTLARVRDSLSGRINGYLQLQAEYDKLQLEITTLRDFLQNLKQNLNNATVEERHKTPYFVTVDAAAPPSTPVFPILWLNLLVAWVFGLAGGIFLALFLNYIDRVRERKNVI